MVAQTRECGGVEYLKRYSVLVTEYSRRIARTPSSKFDTYATPPPRSRFSFTFGVNQLVYRMNKCAILSTAGTKIDWEFIISIKLYGTYRNIFYSEAVSAGGHEGRFSCRQQTFLGNGSNAIHYYIFSLLP